MKELRKEFIGSGEVAGFEFLQLDRSDKAFIYQVSIDGVVNHYEVFKRKIQKEGTRMMNGKEIFYAESELYPSAKRFGVTTLTFKIKEEAYKYFNSIK